MLETAAVKPNGKATTSSPSKPASASNRTMGKKRKSTSLPNETVEYLKAWMLSPAHFAHPYPTESEKSQIMAETGIEMKQLTNWFVNNRKRFWKPRVEARLREQQRGNEPPIIKRDGSVLSLVDLESARSTLMPSDATSPNRKKLKRRVKKVTIVDALTAATSSTSHPEPTSMIVSEQNSVVSTTSSCDDDDVEDACSTSSSFFEPEVSTEQTPTKTECVNIHILRPTNGTKPGLSDVTVLQNVPSERILRTYQDCALTYQDDDSQKLQSRRDSEIVRIKKHYLGVYLANDYETDLSQALLLSNNKRRRLEHVVVPRKVLQAPSLAAWKEYCLEAHDDQHLPSLEEATRLFGYAP